MTVKNFDEIIDNELRIGKDGPYVQNVSGLGILRFLNSSTFISMDVGEPTDNSHLVPVSYVQGSDPGQKKLIEFRLTSYHGAYNQSIGVYATSTTHILAGQCLFKWSVLHNLLSSPTVTLSLTGKKTSSASCGIRLRAIKLSDDSVTDLLTLSSQPYGYTWEVKQYDVSYDLSNLDTTEDYRLQLEIARSAGGGGIYIREASILFDELV